ncbi:hypothetical protein ABH920_009806 [Catenulispora sp. EB89]
MRKIAHATQRALSIRTRGYSRYFNWYVYHNM